MKTISTYINEGVNTSTLIKKIENEFKKEFDNKVTIGKGRSNYQMLYDVYVYDMSLDILKKVNEILKKYLAPKYKGLSDDELQKKIDEQQEFLNKHKDDKYVTLDRYPIEFIRFSSRDLKNLNK